MSNLLIGIDADAFRLFDGCDFKPTPCVARFDLSFAG